MYNQNGTYYTEEHAVSFGTLANKVIDGVDNTYFLDQANTWTDWHLIPSSRISIAQPTIVTKYVEIPGSDGILDLSNFLHGRPTYGQRQGSMSFIVDNDHERWETIREKIVGFLHGKRVKMRLMDDPEYYYEGRYTVGNWESGGDHSSITIEYQLDPFKLRTSYDTRTMTVAGNAKSFNIIGNECSFTPYARWVSGNVTVSFGGVTQTLSSAETKRLGYSIMGSSPVVVSGTGAVIILWRGGKL